MRITSLLFCLLPAPLSSFSAASQPSLLLTPASLQTLQSTVVTNPTASTFYTLLLGRAEWILSQPPVVRPAPGPLGILPQARQVLDFVMTTGLAYLISGNSTYADRAVLETLSFSGVSGPNNSWVDWNPAHWLDTAELSTAAGLAWDWLGSYLSPAQKQQILQGFLRMGLGPYFQGFSSSNSVYRKDMWWVNQTVNWNCVCSAGGMVLPLAFLSDSASISSGLVNSSVLQMAQLVFNSSLSSLPSCMAAYAPEGSWMEGPTYWEYASKYNVYAAAAVESALGSDLGLASLPGVAAGGSFGSYMTGSSSLLYDWADSETVFGGAPSFLQWWGRQYGDAASSYFSQRLTLGYASFMLHISSAWGMFAEALLFFDSNATAASYAAQPLGRVYPERGIVALKSSWLGGEASGADAVRQGALPTDAAGSPASPLPSPALSTGAGSNFFSAKGGSNTWSHAHLDLGSFAWDLHGARVAQDMGADNYGERGNG